MALKRKSLAELHREEIHAENVGVPIPMPTPQPSAPEKEITLYEKRNPKSDFVKMSITVEPELFEEIQNLSKTRRKQKQEFTFSAIIRDALKLYLQH